MLDISREPMEVAPTAHYSMGGIVVDPETHATDVPGLYAAGECVGGLHGANRLGGNSLAETLVFGRRAGEAAAAFALESEVLHPSRRAIDDGARRAGRADAARAPSSPVRSSAAARPDVGALRGRPRRGRPAARACASSRRSARPPPTSTCGRAPKGWTDLAHALDLRAGLAVAEATLRGAIERRETRGAHNRTDFPELDPALQVNFYVDARMEPWSEPVPPVPDELREWVERPVEVSAERLLE